MKRYRMDNWSEYNKSLVNRGRVNLWIDQKGLQKWLAKKQKGKYGRPCIYSDDAIIIALMVREIYHLPLRALEGLLRSIFESFKIDLPVPSYTQICRRAAKLKLSLSKIKKKGPIDIVFDSTGLKLYGEGEWKVRTHGAGKRRTWKKIHIGIDPHTHQILTAEITDRDVGDAESARRMLEKIETNLGTVYGDGAYDAQELRTKIFDLEGKLLCPPPKNAKVGWKSSGWKKERDNDILEILGLGGDEEARKLWKKLKGYHKRSLVETTMFRLKKILGEGLKSRKLETQETEIICKVLVLNKMMKFGRPKNGRVELVA